MTIFGDGEQGSFLDWLLSFWTTGSQVGTEA